MSSNLSHRLKTWQSKATIQLVKNGLNLGSYLSPTRAGKFAFHIFSTPRKGRLKEKDRTYLEKSEQTTLYLNEISIACYDFGGDASKTVLLMHGWESNSARWRTLANVLQTQGFRVVMFDAPAHGGSGNPYFNVLLYAQMMQTVVTHYAPTMLIGHSAGAMAIGYFLSHAPIFPIDGTLKKVVFMAAPYDLDSLFNTYQDIIGFNGRIRKQLDHEVYAVDGNETSYYCVENFVKQMPESFKTATACLFVHDENDPIAAIACSETCHSIWKNSDFLRTKGLGHSLQHKTVYEKIVQFLS
ncbi:MAG: hypothetical protein RL757_2052 [Bacteroidota bacterium]